MLHLFAGWRGLHLLIAHFPIILLLVAPFFVLLGISLSPAKKQLFLESALTLMVIGTAMTFAAVMTGKAEMKLVSSTPVSNAALEAHRALAGATLDLFIVLTLGFAALLFVPRLMGCEIESRVNTALFAVYLVLYASGALFLVNTALQGGRLVRELEAKTSAVYQLSGREITR